MSEPELLPCPFCGGAAFTLGPASEAGGCPECQFMLADRHKPEPKGWRERWNRRTPASTVLPEARSADSHTPTQDAREEHYQAAMAMSEKHRKNWVEAVRRIQPLEEACRLMISGEWDAACKAARRALLPPGK